MAVTAASTRSWVARVLALVVLALGLPTTDVLVVSQVVLSFGIPFALVPLVALTRNRALMGDQANRWFTTLGAILAAVFLIVLNGLLLWLTFTG